MKKIFLLFCIFIFIISLTSAFTWTSVEHYYKFDGTSGAVIDELGTADGTIGNSTTRGATGIINNAFDFENSSQNYVNLGTGNFNFSDWQNMTITAWIKLESYNPSFVQMIYSDRDPGHFFGIRGEADALNKRKLDFYSSSGNIYANTELNLNEWYFVAIVVNGTTGTFYVNGTADGTGSVTLVNGQDAWIGGEKSATNYFFDGLIDEVGFFSRALSPSEISELYNSGSGLPYTHQQIYINLNYPSNNSIISDNSIQFNSSGTNITTLNLEWKNITYYVWNTSGVFNTSFVDIADGVTFEDSYNISGFDIGNYKWNVYGCYGNATLSNCTWSGQGNYSYFVGLNINSIKYNNEVLGGELGNINISLSYNPSLITASGISVTLNYNGTNYSTTQSGISPNLTFNSEVYANNFNSVTLVPFYFTISVTTDTGIIIVNSGIYNQSVNPFLIDDCSSYSKSLLNLTMFDEDTLQPINGTIKMTANIYSYNTNNLVSSYNKTFDYKTDTQSRICLGNISTNYSLSYSIQYSGDETIYYPKFKNIQMMTINNDTSSQKIELYNINLTRAYPFAIIVVGNLLSSNGNSGLLVDAQRQYLGLDSFKSIESSVTSADGTAISHLIQNSEVYNFIISYNGIVLGTFNNYQVKCANAPLGQCSITLNLAQATGTIPNFETYGDITQVFLLNEDTHTLYQTFSSTDGESKTVRSVVFRDDGYGNTTICNNSIIGTSGTFTCTIPTIYQNESFFVQTFSDGFYLGSKFFSQGVTVNWYGADMFIYLLMFSALVLLLIGHPVLIIIGAILGLASPAILISIGGATLSNVIVSVIYYICAGVIAIIVIQKKM